jgi:Flp pilus assembly protein TadD
MLSEVYRKFAGFYSGDQVRYIPSYEDLGDEDGRALAQADILVQQILDFEPRVDLSITKAGVRHHLVPFVTAAFLWPFATEAHIRNTPLLFLRDGPYPPQLGDAYLNRKIAAGIDPKTAVAEYLVQDLARIAHLDRRYELMMEKQRQRDSIAGYNLADLIDRYFRSEAVFLSPAHPELRMALELATQFFTAMDAGNDAVGRLKREVLVTPFPKDELPIHPSVCRHFGLNFIADPDAQRYRYRYEGSFTFREFALRYMKYEWNRDLDEGVALSMSGEIAEAVDKLSTALMQSPHSGEGHLHMAACLAQMGRLDEAIAAAYKAVELDQTCAAASWNLLSHLFLQQRKNEQAVAAARHAVLLNPSDVHHSAHLGELLKQSGDLTGAVEAFQWASTLSPPDACALAQLGELRAATGAIEEGLVALRRAIDIEPENAGLRDSLSRTLERHGKFHAAIAAVRQAAALDARNPHYSAHLGDLLLRIGDREGAEAAYEAAIRLDPGHAHPYSALGSLFSTAGRHSEAIAMSQNAAALEPSNAYRYAQLGNVLMQAGQFPSAKEMIDRAIGIMPQVADFHADLSHAFSRAGRLSEAIVAVRAAIRLAPKRWGFHAQLGDLLLRNGDAVSAERHLRIAVERDPGNAHFRAGLSRVLVQLQRVQEARLLAEQAVTLDPDDAGLQLHFQSLVSLDMPGSSEEPPAAPRTDPVHPVPPTTNKPVGVPDLAGVPLRDLMMRFESLGESCEFGLAQRRCEAEPLGLFRFASAPLPKLLAALTEDFAGFGEPENIEVKSFAGSCEYMISDGKFDLLYHTWVTVGEMTPEEVHRREIRRLPLLIRKLREDLAAAEKIFVHHGMGHPNPGEALPLAQALRRYGPNTLLWVDLADRDHPAGSAEWAGPGLIRGYIDRFAPSENAHDLSFDCWVNLCREAWRLYGAR